MRSKFRIKRPRVWDDIKTITLPRYFGSGGKLSLRSGKFARDDITRFGMSGRITNYGNASWIRSRRQRRRNFRMAGLNHMDWPMRVHPS